MPRTYSESFLRELASADQNALGIRLATACVNGRLPALYVARVLGVSQRTIHLWFRGKTITIPYLDKVEGFIKDVERDLGLQILPVKDLKAAKHYLSKAETAVGVEF